MMPRGGIREGSGRKPNELRHYTVGAYCENEFNTSIKKEISKRIKAETKPIQHIYDKQKKIPKHKRSAYLTSEEYEEDNAKIEDFLVCWQGFSNELERYCKSPVNFELIDKFEPVNFELIDKFEKVRVIAIRDPNKKSKFTFNTKNKIIEKAIKKFQLKRTTVINYWSQFKRDQQ
jgi:hypothetical protein